MENERTLAGQERESDTYSAIEEIVVKTSPFTLPALVMATPVVCEIFKPEVLSNFDVYGCFLPQAVIAGMAGFAFAYLTPKNR